MSNKATGSRAERQLSDMLEDEFGFAAYRAPGSGGATDRPRPDIKATREVVTESDLTTVVAEGFAIEVKSRSDGTVTFTADEIHALREYARRGGLTPIVAVKPDLRTHDQWYCYDARELNETPKGYSVRKQDHPHARTLTEVFGE